MERKIKALDCPNYYRPCSESKCPAYVSVDKDIILVENCLLDKPVPNIMKELREAGIRIKKTKKVLWGTDGRNPI
jgi:hypothetical protein